MYVLEDEKGIEAMTNKEFEEAHEIAFDAFCKSVIRNACRDAHRKLNTHKKYECQIAHIIKNGQSYLHHTPFVSYRHPKGWQVLVRCGKDGEAFAVIHTFDGSLPEEISVELPADCGHKVAALYSDTDETVTVSDGRLIYHPTENFKAVAVHLIK